MGKEKMIIFVKNNTIMTDNEIDYRFRQLESKLDNLGIDYYKYRISRYYRTIIIGICFLLGLTIGFLL